MQKHPISLSAHELNGFTKIYNSKCICLFIM